MDGNPYAQAEAEIMLGQPVPPVRGESLQDKTARRQELYIEIGTNFKDGAEVPRCTKLNFPQQYYSHEARYALIPPEHLPHVPNGGRPQMALLVEEEDGSFARVGAATMAFGDSSFIMHTERFEDGSRYEDVSYGPLKMMDELGPLREIMERNDPRDAETHPIIAGPQVVRYYYDAQDRMYAAHRLNCFRRPISADREIMWVLSFFDPATANQTECWSWMSDMYGNDLWSRQVFAPDGRRLRMEKCSGQVQYFSGPRGREALRMSVYPPDQAYGVAHEAYAGPFGRSYLTRRTWKDGTVAFYKGTTPQRVILDRKWHPDGRMQHYNGRFGEEVCYATTFVLRTPEDAALPSPPDTPPEPPAPPPNQYVQLHNGARVRGTGLRRNDLNNRAGVITGYCAESGRVTVVFGKLAPCNVKPENLLMEEEFQAARAAREANSTAAERERRGLRRAQQLQRQQERGELERAAAVLASAEAAPHDPTVAPARAPAKVRCSIREMVCCPLSGDLMRNAVLAADGYVYEQPALQAHWEEHGFVSPITGDVVSGAVFPHMPLRSLAREVADSPGDAKWTRVSAEAFDLLECPITQDVMADPVRAADGQVYERDALAQWFSSGRDTSPLTNAPIGSEVREDLTMRAYCAAWA